MAAVELELQYQLCNLSISSESKPAELDGRKTIQKHRYVGLFWLPFELIQDIAERLDREDLLHLIHCSVSSKHIFSQRFFRSFFRSLVIRSCAPPCPSHPSLKQRNGWSTPPLPSTPTRKRGNAKSSPSRILISNAEVDWLGAYVLMDFVCIFCMKVPKAVESGLLEQSLRMGEWRKGCFCCQGSERRLGNFTMLDTGLLNCGECLKVSFCTDCDEFKQECHGDSETKCLRNLACPSCYDAAFRRCAHCDVVLDRCSGCALTFRVRYSRSGQRDRLVFCAEECRDAFLAMADFHQNGAPTQGGATMNAVAVA